MEKNNSKVVAVVALVVAVVALSIGFAALSATLTISTDTNVTVTPANTFAANISYTGTASCTPSGDATVGNAGTLSTTDWNGIVVTLKTPGDSVTCQATVTNASTFDGYLKSITPDDSNITCQAASSNGASASIVTTVCSEISMTVGAGPTTGAENVTQPVTSSSHTALTGISTNNLITKAGGSNNTHLVKVTITYDSQGTLADGDIVVNVPGFSLAYNTDNA